MKENNKILNKIINIIKEAGQTALSYYNKDYEIKKKAKDSLVTTADLESEKIILNGLKEFGYGVLSEELTDSKERLKKERVWIIDPLDGTMDFINQTGEFTIMIGLVENAKPVMGLVYKPVDDILYYAVKGQRAYRMESKKSKKLKVSEIKSFKEIKMVTSRFHLSPDIKKISDNLGITQSVPCGSAGLKLSYIAEQKADLNINTSQHTYEWDLCAADIILSEAGGKLTDTRGNGFIYNKKDPRNYRGYVASNGVIHDKVIGVLRGLGKQDTMN